MKNIFEIFDSLNTGKINQNEILWVFSMAMNGTGSKLSMITVLPSVHLSSAKAPVVVQAV